MKYTKIFRILAAALILALLAVAVPARPALAQAYLDVSPSQGEVDDRIDIYGNYFNASATVYIYFVSDEAAEGDRLDYEVESYEHVRSVASSATGDFYTYLTVPDELDDGDEEHNVRGGTYYICATYSGSRIIQAVDRFTVETTGEITLDLDGGVVGTEVEITGTGFDEEEDIEVQYDGDEVDIESGDDETDNDGEFSCTVIIPESAAGEHTITVIGGDSEIEIEATFTVEPKITIAPESGAAGTTITVSGTGFGYRVDFSIFFDVDAVIEDETTDRDGSFEATFTVPSKGAGSYDVEAEDEDDNLDTAEFTITAAAASFSPTSGHAGTEVTVSGTGFGASQEITITFDAMEVKKTTSEADGSFSASFTVPERGAGTYKIKASDGTNTKESNFEIIVSASISPVTSTASPGHIGSKLTISGTGFIPGKTVTVTYDGNQATTTIVNTDGTFSATFDAPASTGGAHTIVATDLTNTQQFTFVMESTPPPTPRPLKPEMSIKAEAQAYFDWEEVTDPSGVTYTLQIATENFTSESFSEGSIVLEKTGLTQTEYTITEIEALESVSKDSPYYWHVKAIDGALNESQWSGAGSFYVGFSFGLPQPIIYTLCGIGALLLGIFGFWLGRKTAYY